MFCGEQGEVWGPRGNEDMRIQLNGKEKEIEAGTTVQGLLDALGAVSASVAVERNAQLVPRKTFADLVLEGGDEVEIVTFVGGG